jgi:hypothetical protein
VAVQDICLAAQDTHLALQICACRIIAKIVKVTFQARRQKIYFTCVYRGRVDISSLSRHGSKDPHRPEQKFIYSFSFDVTLSIQTSPFCKKI